MTDLISRQAAIDAVWSLDVELRPSAIEAILDRLNGLPSAQSKRGRGKLVKLAPLEDIIKVPTADVRENVKGKWIKKKGSLWSLATCSVCGELSVEGDKPFCPNCGAQMIGDKENDERI